MYLPCSLFCHLIERAARRDPTSDNRGNLTTTHCSVFSSRSESSYLQSSLLACRDRGKTIDDNVISSAELSSILQFFLHVLSPFDDFFIVSDILNSLFSSSGTLSSSYLQDISTFKTGLDQRLLWVKLLSHQAGRKFPVSLPWVSRRTPML